MPSRAASPAIITLVHLSDVHMRSNFDAPQRLHFALQAVRENDPALIINTGDTIDGPAGHEEKWQLWKACVKKELKDLPLYNVLGNHDIESPVTREAACRELNMPSRYYAFDKAGWHFIMLDGNGLGNDPGQWNWLLEQLAATPVATPVAIATHEPVFSMAAMLHYPGSMSARWKELVALFVRHPNVKLCMGGHVHLADVCRYNGVTYANAGALGGYWWEIEKSTNGKGGFHETPPGFNLIKLSPTDVVSVEYTRYPDPFIDKSP